MEVNEGQVGTVTKVLDTQWPTGRQNGLLESVDFRDTSVTVATFLH